MDEDAKVIGINSFSEAGKQGLNFAIGVADVKRFLSSGGNRSAEIAPSSPGSTPQPAEGCKPRRYDTVVDQKSKKLVTPIDTLCRGRPNLYLFGARAENPPEFALIDDLGDGKFDQMIIFKFDGKTDLWIFYGNRDGVPTAFGYDYQHKGTPDLVVAVNAAVLQ